MVGPRTLPSHSRRQALPPPSPLLGKGQCDPSTHTAVRDPQLLVHRGGVSWGSIHHSAFLSCDTDSLPCHKAWSLGPVLCVPWKHHVYSSSRSSWLQGGLALQLHPGAMIISCIRNPPWPTGGPALVAVLASTLEASLPPSLQCGCTAMGGVAPGLSSHTSPLAPIAKLGS